MANCKNIITDSLRRTSIASGGAVENGEFEEAMSKSPGGMFRVDATSGDECILETARPQRVSQEDDHEHGAPTLATGEVGKSNRRRKHPGRRRRPAPPPGD